MDKVSGELHKLKIDKSMRPQHRPRSTKGVVIGLLVVVVAALIGFIAFRQPGVAVTVTVVRPRLETASRSAVLVATGYVIPRHKIQVGSKIMGRVAWIGVEKGEHVRTGQLVVRLEDREYRAQHDQARAAFETAQARLNELEQGSRPEEIDRARSDMERAAAQLRTEDAQFRRIEGLVREGVSAAQAIDEARGRLDGARANVASLTKTYELAQKGPRQEQIASGRSEVERARAAMEYAQTILDAAEIKVPIEGTILERNVEQGEMVTTSFVGDRGAKSFVVTLANLRDIQVELDINQNDFNRILPEQPCTVVTDAFPDRVYKCVVDEIAPEANRQKATVQVKVKFTEPDEYVRPEMNARVTFLNPDAKPDQPDMYVVPKGAVIEREAGKAVFVLAGGVVQAKPITVEREVGSDVFVSAGLIGGEAIIVGEELLQLTPGDRVSMRE